MIINPKLSIIVPVYNVEKYLPKCLDSLLNQKLRDIEIIIVDDGSPDSSGYIADRFADLDSRVRVVHKDNGGLGPARNTGIEYALGEYIGFVDSDDWVDPDMYLNLYESGVAEKADIVVGGFEIWSNGKKVKSASHPLAGRTIRGINNIERYRRLLFGRLPKDGLSEPWPVEVWTSIYSAGLIKKSNARFKNVLSEDTFFNIEIEKYAECITYVDFCGYRYRKDCQPSITNSLDSGTLARFTGLFQQLIVVSESDVEPDDALLRVRRKILDYARTFAYMVEKSNLKMGQKISLLSQLGETPEFIQNCRNYPTDGLSRYQSLFHQSLINRNYLVVLLMARAKLLLKGDG